MNDVQPLVSIIVPIYNSEAYLERCLDSLVHQTLENIEILAINNGSTDRSLEIIETYAESYSHLRCITIPHHERAGAGRNYGILQSRANYIAFCDSDDYMELDALENLYKTAVENNLCDLVYSPFYHVNNGSSKLVFRLKDISIETLILSGNFALWNKLYRRELIERVGEMPTDFSFEDFAYYPVLVSYAHTIAYLDTPTYYYVCREGSEVNAATSVRMLDALKSADYNLAHVNPKYKDIMMFSDVQRLLNSMNDRWVFFDAYANYFSQHMEEYKKNLIFYSSNNILSKLEDIISEILGCFNNKVFISGFGGNNDEFIDYVEKSAFYNGAEVIILNESNCDIYENNVIRSLYDNEKFDLVAQYFSLKRIYNEGGVYIDSCLKIDCPLNYLKRTNSFFSFSTEFDFSDKIFGGRQNQQIFEDLLGTFTSNYFLGSDASLSARIKNLLCAKYGVSLNGLTSIHKYEVSVFSPDVFLYDFGCLNSSTDIHFTSIKAYNDDNYTVVDKNALKLILKKYNKQEKVLDKKLVNRCAALEKELRDIKTSNAWNLIQKIKKYRHTFFYKTAKRLYLKARKKGKV